MKQYDDDGVLRLPLSFGEPVDEGGLPEGILDGVPEEIRADVEPMLRAALADDVKPISEYERTTLRMAMRHIRADVDIMAQGLENDNWGLVMRALEDLVRLIVMDDDQVGAVPRLFSQVAGPKVIIQLSQTPRISYDEFYVAIKARVPELMEVED